MKIYELLIFEDDAVSPESNVVPLNPPSQTSTTQPNSQPSTTPNFGPRYTDVRPLDQMTPTGPYAHNPTGQPTPYGNPVSPANPDPRTAANVNAPQPQPAQTAGTQPFKPTAQNPGSFPNSGMSPEEFKAARSAHMKAYQAGTGPYAGTGGRGGGGWMGGSADGPVSKLNPWIRLKPWL